MKLKIKTLLLFLIGITITGSAFAQTKVIAHRGYWNTEGSSQNSIAALQKAAKTKCYGSEFDVSISKDGILVVNHDDDVDGKVIETSNYSDFWNHHLSNGETLPTLEQYLAIGKQYPDMQLILEIKPHKKEINENRAVDNIIDMVKRMGMEKQVEYISFSMNICERVNKKSPSSKIAYLGGDIAPRTIKDKGLTGIDYEYTIYEEHPEWLDEASKSGLEINVWTVNDVNKLKEYAADKRIGFITTNCPTELSDIIRITTIHNTVNQQ